MSGESFLHFYDDGLFIGQFGIPAPTTGAKMAERLFQSRLSSGNASSRHWQR